MKGKQSVISQVAVIVSIVLSLIGGGACGRPARGTEQGPAMTDLSNLDQFKQSFERDRGKVRLVSLLSPV